ncbi:TRAP transporter small permease [Mangrovicoccus sp. HB161399]|uniref:TRAP transporter small permease n=1 Tax=Mangrovicoccus sp. HB161399 TaxID=2720392 RepID=UPI00155832CD|nr:TRAP transporter small permease subunit [Mangrovicoccus sp. HB161399]
MVRALPGRAALARLLSLGAGAGMALLAAMAGLVILQVAARNFADAGLPWADEAARFCGIGLVFLAVPLLALRQVLVAVTLGPDLMPLPLRRAAGLVSDLATLAFAGLMLWSFAAFLPRAGKFLTPAIGLPNWIYYSLALAGCLLLAAAAAFRTAAALAGRSACPAAAERNAGTPAAATGAAP